MWELKWGLGKTLLLRGSCFICESESFSFLKEAKLFLPPVRSGTSPTVERFQKKIVSIDRFVFVALTMTTWG